jgi:hypothetical protein
MMTIRIVTAALVAVAVAGCREIAVPTEAAESQTRREDGGAYTGAGFDTAPADTGSARNGVLVGSGH